MRPTDWGWFAAATLAGGFGRYAIGGALNSVFPSFPFGTMLVNAAGCIVIGVVDALSQDRLKLGPEARLALATGFCGAFTTFSALVMETEHLLRAGEFLRAACNVGVSLVLGLIAFRLGWTVARLWAL